METINNIAAVAAKAVWGDNEANKEPVSGERGDVSKGQPYDAGNLEDAERERARDNQDPSRNSEPGAISSATTTSTSNTAIPSTNNATIPSTGNTTIPSTSNTAIPSTNNTDIPSANNTAIPSTNNTDIPSTSNVAKPSTTDTANPSTSDTGIPSTAVGEAASVTKPSVTDASGAQPSLSDTTAAQNDTRDPDDESAQIEPKGPGPRPLNVVAKEHGGDAGNDHGHDSKDTKSSTSSSEDKVNAELADNPEAQGSGKIVVKASGLAADGGDFDATKPGAGKEADRLMDVKGLHHEQGGSGTSSGSNHGHTKDKPSLSERIKAKLHKH